MSFLPTLTSSLDADGAAGFAAIFFGFEAIAQGVKLEVSTRGGCGVPDLIDLLNCRRLNRAAGGTLLIHSTCCGFRCYLSLISR